MKTIVHTKRFPNLPPQVIFFQMEMIRTKFIDVVHKTLN